MIIHPEGSIPIEIKSPANRWKFPSKVFASLKIKLFCHDGGYPANLQTTSLLLVFNPPNYWSEVHELVENIYTTFGIRVGVVDFRSLLWLAVVAISTGTKLSSKIFAP